MPCDPNSINVTIPDGPAGPTIPGFGVSFDLKLPDIGLNIPPPDLSGIFDLLSFHTPAGKMKSPLNPNYGRDIIDGVIKLLDNILPYLMIYKFFLPLLKLILCILEVVCALPSPRKVSRAVRRLFRECIPEFLNLFPIFAILLLILAILLLILQLIAYIIILILKIIDLLLRNIRALKRAIEYKDANAVLAIARKIGMVLCLLQNLFVVFLMIEFIISIIKDILSLSFNVPPCGDDAECCTADICPEFLKSDQIVNSTGKMLCISQVLGDTNPLYPGLTQTIRAQSFQFYDLNQTNEYKQFINMIRAKELTSDYTIYYPTDSTYTADTPVNQAPYTIDITADYDPAAWGRTSAEDGVARKIIFKDCIVIAAAYDTLTNDQNVSSSNPTGTLLLSGGLGFEADGTTILYGYDSNTPQVHTKTQATLNTFLFIPESTLSQSAPVPPSTVPPPFNLPHDSILLSNIEYTFKINHEVLISKGLTTYGCMPSVSEEKTITNALFTNEANDKISQLKNFQFPDVTAARECAFLAIDGLRISGNLTEEYVTNVFQPTITNCLLTLNNDTKDKVNQIIPIGFDQYKSTLAIDIPIQFTTGVVTVKVDLKTSDDNSMITNLPADCASTLAARIVPTVTFGEIGPFTYDGTTYFEAQIKSNKAGKGQVTVAFDNKVFSNIIVPTNIDDPRTITPKTADYQFIYTPVSSAVSVGIGDASDGSAPRRDESDVSRDGE